MLHSGLDLHKRTLAISHRRCRGSARPRTCSCRPRRDAITAYFAALPGGPGAQRAVVESTSNWYWLRDLLATQGVDLRLAHSKHVKAISYAKVKTDAVDAATLAQLLRGDLVPEAHMISPEWREARDLLRARLQLVRQQVRVKNTVTGLFAQYNVTDPDALPALVRLRVELLREQFALLGDQAKRLAARLNPVLIPTPEVQRLLWIPGIGRVVAFTIWLEVDGIQRFPSARDFVSYCRLVPARATRAGRHGISAPRTATGISSSRSATRPSARSSTSRRSARSTSGFAGASRPSSRAPSSPRSSHASCTTSSRSRRRSTVRSRARP
jgi:transposase